MNFSKKRVFKFLFFAVLFFGFIIAWLGFGERGITHLYRMEKERQTYIAKITKLEIENQELLTEINRLKKDKNYIETVARRELGLIKDDEILYRFIKPEKKREGVKK